LKGIYSPTEEIYGYVKKSPLTNNYQYYESRIDRSIGLDFTKGRYYNENVVNN
jgi:hypothetical protein